ncbi:tetratricopeptide repeat protein [Calothrix sp. 336/3]|uniref:tetratricopeptide repeat protein n=1 Tax=Calothrix sp. 336/3 TaxID=1337936 RepID=UPI0004E318B1|nr:tetratricopeptide repeat protein [Calothrix sp. 336/3]AKG20345.1 tetratricopeptide TPR_2 repeat-containing protein [Calothrix sp. 336/3]
MNHESYNKGLELAKQQNFAEAIAHFTQAITEVPNFPEGYLRRGLAYYNSGDNLRAIGDYNEALKLNPQFLEAYYSRGLAKLALKNLPGTLADAEAAIRINYNYAPAHQLRGIVKRKLGSLQEAIANFKQAAELYLQQKDKEGCQSCLASIKQLQSPSPVTTVSPTPTKPLISPQEYFTQLLDKAENGDTHQALEDLNWALGIDSQDAQALCCRGVVYCKQGKYQQAIADFNQALRLNFTDVIVYRNRGRARLALGDHQGAIADFNQAIQLQPQDTLIYTARGQAYHAIGNYLGAIQDYSQALQINPDDASAYYNRALTHTCLEEMQAAISDYQKAASIYCEKEDWGNYQQVLSSLNKIQSLAPEVKKSQQNLLRQRLQRMVGGYWEIAARLIEQAKYNYPGMPESWYMEKVIADLERERGRE